MPQNFYLYIPYTYFLVVELKVDIIQKLRKRISKVRGRAGSDGVERPRSSGSDTDFHPQYLSLNQTEPAGRPGCYSSRSENATLRAHQEPACVVQKSRLHQHCRI
eukprot:1027527-Pleurochrysis_carterae.AAC.2